MPGSGLKVRCGGGGGGGGGWWWWVVVLKGTLVFCFGPKYWFKTEDLAQAEQYLFKKLYNLLYQPCTVYYASDLSFIDKNAFLSYNKVQENYYQNIVYF